MFAYQRSIATLFLLFAAAACDETDAVAVRIRLQPDFSGSVTTSGLALPVADGELAAHSTGATWQSKVEVIAAAGHFDQLNDLKLADISFRVGEDSEGIAFLRVRLPRGESVEWAKALVPLSPDERAQAASALDPSGRTKNVGTTIKFEIELPDAIIGNGISGRTRGTRGKVEGQVGTLTVPLETALSDGDPIIWHLTWQK